VWDLSSQSSRPRIFCRSPPWIYAARQLPRSSSRSSHHIAYRSPLLAAFGPVQALGTTAAPAAMPTDVGMILTSISREPRAAPSDRLRGGLESPPLSNEIIRPGPTTAR
jgi:hypothetical protein